jgi:hypothetical protein
MKRPRLPRRMLLASLLVILALPVGDAAYGYWRGSGSGAGSATAGTTLAVTLSPGTPTADLYPGGVANVVLTVSNPNAYAVQIGSLSLDSGQGTGGLAVDAGHSGCAVSTLSFTTQTNGGAGWSIAARVGAVNGMLSVTLTNALAMAVGAANACQGTSSTVYLVAGP